MTKKTPYYAVRAKSCFNKKDWIPQNGAKLHKSGQLLEKHNKSVTLKKSVLLIGGFQGDYDIWSISRIEERQDSPHTVQFAGTGEAAE